MLTWHAHEGAVTALAFGPGGRFLVSAGTDGRVRAWDPLSGTECWTAGLGIADDLRSPGDRIASAQSVALAAGRVVVVSPALGLVVLDLATGRELDSHPLSDVQALKAAPDGNTVFALVDAGSYGRRLLRYDLLDGTEATLPGLISRAARALAFAPDGKSVAAGRVVYPWPPTDPPREFTVRMKNYEPDDLAFSHDNSHLFALVVGKVAVYELPHGLFRTKLKGHTGRITAMALTPDGRKLWTASRDATVKCWDTAALTLDRTYTFQTGGLGCLAVSPAGDVAAVGSGQKGTITLWDLG